MSLIVKVKNHEKLIYVATIIILSGINIFLQVNLRELKATYGDRGSFLKFANECKQMHEIVDAQSYGAIFEGSSFPAFSFGSLSGNLYSFPNPDYTYTLLILFSFKDCNVCLEEEMKITEEFYQKSLTQKMNIAVFAVGYAPDINVIARFKRLNNVSFPLLYDRTDTLRQILQIYKTPLVFLIHNASQKIMKAHHPAPEAPKLSTSFIQFVNRLVDPHLTNKTVNEIEFPRF